jgi:hypothetical protein
MKEPIKSREHSEILGGNSHNGNQRADGILRSFQKSLICDGLADKKCAAIGKRDGRSSHARFWPPKFWFVWPPFIEKKEPQPPLDRPGEFEGVIKGTTLNTLIFCGEIYQAHSTEVEKNYREAEADVSRAKQKITDIQREQSELKREKEKAAENSRRAESEKHDLLVELERLPSPEIKKLPMWIWLLFGGIAEGLLLIPAFFSEGAVLWQASLLGLLVGSFIASCCHLLGKALKSEEKKRFDFIIMIFSGLMLAVLAAYIAVFSFHRTKFAELLAKSQLGKTLLPSWLTFWSFLIIISVILIVMFLTSYLGSHAFPIKLRGLKKSLKRIKDTLKRTKWYEEKIAESIRELQKEKEECDDKFFEAAFRVNNSLTIYRRLHMIYLEKLKEITANGITKTQIYRDENIRARSDGKTHKWPEITPVTCEPLNLKALEGQEDVARFYEMEDSHVEN